MGPARLRPDDLEYPKRQKNGAVFERLSATNHSAERALGLVSEFIPIN